MPIWVDVMASLFQVGWLISNFWCRFSQNAKKNFANFHLNMVLRANFQAGSLRRGFMARLSHPINSHPSPINRRCCHEEQTRSVADPSLQLLPRAARTTNFRSRQPPTALFLLLVNSLEFFSFFNLIRRYRAWRCYVMKLASPCSATSLFIQHRALQEILSILR
jgi:hypothetical protein